MNHTFTVEVAEDLGALEALEPEWWSLWRRSPGATPFQSPAWLIPWWRAFHPGALHTVTIRNGRELVGLAPFYIEQGARGRRILPVGISVSDYLDVLVDPVSAETAGRAIVAHLEGASDPWDSWDMEELPPGAAALALPCPESCEETVTVQNACPVLTLAPGAEGLVGAVPKTKMRKLRMAQHRLDRRGDAEVVQVAADRADHFLNELFRLHDARWQSRGEAGVLADETVRRFHRDAICGLVEAGLARLFLLRAGDQIAGAYYGFLKGGCGHAYLGGFDPAFTFESPGTILVRHAITEAAREGAREFHFLRGREAYKYEWGAEDRWNKRRSFRRRAAIPPHG